MARYDVSVAAPIDRRGGPIDVNPAHFDFHVVFGGDPERVVARIAMRKDTLPTENEK